MDDSEILIKKLNNISERLSELENNSVSNRDLNNLNVSFQEQILKLQRQLSLSTRIIKETVQKFSEHDDLSDILKQIDLINKT
jgi:hypothetical protein